MTELPGKNIFVIRYETDTKSYTTSALRDLGYQPSKHDISGVPHAPWIFVDMDSMLYCTGKIGVEVAKPIYWHQITLEEFDQIHRRFAKGEEIVSYLEQLDARYHGLDWREFPLADDPNYQYYMQQVGSWRQKLAEAMKAQTDAKGCHYVTDQDVAEVLTNFDDRWTIFAIKNKKDPAILAAKYALRFRKFTQTEILAFKNEFRRLLKDEYEAYCATYNLEYTADQYEALSAPCTDNLARIYLQSGSSPIHLLEYLYLVFPINEWDFTPREKV